MGFLYSVNVLYENSLSWKEVSLDFFLYTSCLVNFFYFLFLRGADDLLPILAFVALRSEMPQLVSECAALEEFIHEG